MELQVSYSVCPEIPEEDVFRRKTVGDRRNTQEIMPMERSRNNRVRGMPVSYTYAGEYPARNERFGVHGMPERKKCAVDFSEMGEHEIRIPKPQILEQGILCRYRGQKYESDKAVYSRPIEAG